MKASAEEYYALLRRNYETEIRRLVPRYDEMIDTIVGLLGSRAPASLLDVGCGVGNVTERVLDALPGARLTAIDASKPMVEDARGRLRRFDDRVRVLQADAVEFEPEEPLAAVYSNLVIHNVPFAEKPHLLAAARRWLAPGGVFVWSDLVRFDDVRLQEQFVRYRIEHALEEGCDRSFVRRSFDKEGQEDYPFTAEAALTALRAAGFAGPELVWAHDTFAIIHAVA